MRYSSFVGHEDAKLALILNAIDLRCGGVLFIGEKGCGKSTLARTLKTILPTETPFIELPLNITEEALIGTISIEDTLRTGKNVFQRGIFARANGGVLFIDDINLLSPEIISLILEVQSRDENIVEREGIRIRHPASFILIATMNPEEGDISPHLLDRFGMCIVFEGLKGVDERIAIVKTALFDGNSISEDELIERIEISKKLLPTISISEDILEYIAEICIHYNVAGHRADIYLLAATRAYSALNNKKVISQEDVNKVAPLVLIHRKRQLQPPSPPEQQEEPPPPPEQNQEHHPNNQEQQNEPPPDNSDKQKHEKPPKPKELPPQKDEVFAIGHTFNLRRITFRKDRIERAATGRRTRTRARNRGGRYVKSLLRKNRDIAIDATLRAAAPYQALRGRKDCLVIEDDDLRYKRKERKMGHLTIFVVDGSGSMGVHKRMVATKGAIQSLLMDSYQKRDRVAMIVFRKDRAEVVLEPTTSVELAARRLREIPVGGKTPLGAGLLETYKLIEKISLKKPETRFLILLITDGRANQSVTQMTLDEEILRISSLFRDINGVDIVVVDTEEKGRFTSMDKAKSLATILDAEYYTIEELKADSLINIVVNSIVDV